VNSAFELGEGKGRSDLEIVRQIRVADEHSADLPCLSFGEFETALVSQTCVSCTVFELVTKTTNVTGSSRRCFMFRMFRKAQPAHARDPPLARQRKA
jgi:hypothetical protein